MKLLFRILSLPFIVCLLLLACVRDVLVLSWLWLKHGGEFFAYRKSPKTIMDVYRKLESQHTTS